MGSATAACRRFARPHRIAGIADRIQQDREFVSPQPKQADVRRQASAVAARDDIFLPQMASEPSADPQQDLITHSSPHAFIEDLEVVHIRQQQRVRPSGVSPRSHKGIFQPVEETTAGWAIRSADREINCARVVLPPACVR